MDQQAMQQPADMKPSVLSGLSPVQIFSGGIVAGVLVLCTIGFFILLGVFMKGGDFSALAGGGKAVAPIVGNTQPDGTGQPSAPITVAGIDEKTDHILGNKNAKVTIVEYSDFQCPFCSRFYPTVKQAMKEFEGDVRLVYRHFPLSNHPEAQPAAEASECAAEQGKFWEFHDKLFENQTSLSAAFYTQTAKELRLNESQFNTCMTSHKYASKVASQAAGGDAAGLQGTPHTIVIGPDGQLVPVSGAQPYSVLEAAIKQFVN